MYVCIIFVCKCRDCFVGHDIDEVVERSWHKKMPSKNMRTFLERVHTKTPVRSRNVHMFLLGIDG